MLVFNSEMGTGSHGNGPLDVGVSMGGEFASDGIDYEEMMGYSHANQLQTEVARLQVECQHWKHLARSKSQQVMIWSRRSAPLCDGMVWGQ